MPLHLQLAEQFRAAVRDGRLQAGHRLPSTRDLARELSVSRSVAQAAYDQLHAEGWIAGRTGSGTYVADVVPLQPSVRQRRKPAPEESEELLTLRPGIPYIATEPDAGWRRAWREVSTQAPARGYDNPAGLPELRAALGGACRPGARDRLRTREPPDHERHHARVASPAQRGAPGGRPDRDRGSGLSQCCCCRSRPRPRDRRHAGRRGRPEGGGAAARPRRRSTSRRRTSTRSAAAYLLPDATN